jgi:hypothetical protein
MRKRLFAICLVLVLLVAATGLSCEPAGEGTIEVKATLDGDPWPGALDYTLTPASGSPISGTDVPGSHSADAGTWTCSYDGGPDGATLVDIAPSETQELSDGGTITFTLNFETEEQVDASITWESWTIDGEQVPPGHYTIYPPTIIDCEYEVVINGTYCESVNVTVSLNLTYHYGGPGEFKSWHVCNAPGSVYTIPPGTISSQNATVNGEVKHFCDKFDAPKCQNVTLGVTFTHEAHKGTTYKYKVNWLRYNASEADDAIFDNLLEWIELGAGIVGISDMVTSACVYVDGDVDPANDCCGDSPMLYITHNYTGIPLPSP